MGLLSAALIEPTSRPISPVRTARRIPRSRPPPVPGMHAMTLRPSSIPLRVPLLAPPESSLLEVPDPESDRARAASPTVSRLLAIAATDPSFESAAASALIAELLDFAAACCLDYATALVAESSSVSPPSVEGECAVGTDVLEDRQEDFECLAATIPRFASMLLAPEGDSDATDIPTLRSYAEVFTGPYSSQWQAAMDAEMASLKSTSTYVDEVPPPGANIINGIWIFRVKRPPGSPRAFKACYVARGFIEPLTTFSRPGASMNSLWTGSPGDALRFCVWGFLCPQFLGHFPSHHFPLQSAQEPLWFLLCPLPRSALEQTPPQHLCMVLRGLPVRCVTRYPSPPSVAPQVSSPSPQSSSQSPQQPSALPPEAAADGEGASVCSADPRGATSGGVGVGAESVPARGSGAWGAGVGVEPGSAGGSSLWGAGVSRAIPRSAMTGGAGAPSAGPGEHGTGRVAGGGAGSGARGAGVGAAAAEATAGVAASAASAAAATAGVAASAAAAAADEARAAAAAAAATAAATSTSFLWPSDPRSPLSLFSLLPSSSCLRSHPPLSPPLSHTWASRSLRARRSSPVPVTNLRTILFRPIPPRSSPSVLPSPLESGLTASLSTPVTDNYCTYRPVLSHVLASLVTDPRASLSSVSALTAAITEFAATRRLDYATSLMAAPPTSPLADEGESALGCDALEDRRFELEFLAAASPHLCAMLLALEGDPGALDIPTPHTSNEAVLEPWAS
ncbi:unnamed protein product [Closterium sp. NIES-54]